MFHILFRKVNLHSAIIEAIGESCFADGMSDVLIFERESSLQLVPDSCFQTGELKHILFPGGFAFPGSIFPSSSAMLHSSNDGGIKRRLF
jgi:hypothetical protein